MIGSGIYGRNAQATQTNWTHRDSQGPVDSMDRMLLWEEVVLMEILFGVVVIWLACWFFACRSYILTDRISTLKGGDLAWMTFALFFAPLALLAGMFYVDSTREIFFMKPPKDKRVDAFDRRAKKFFGVK